MNKSQDTTVQLQPKKHRNIVTALGQSAETTTLCLGVGVGGGRGAGRWS